MFAELELRLDPLLEYVQTKLLQPASRSLRERLFAELRERRAAPEGERLPEQRRTAARVGGGAGLLRQALEAAEIRLVGCDLERIPGRLGFDCIRAERLAQLRYVHLDDLPRARRRTAPEPVDDPFHWDDT